MSEKQVLIAFACLGMLTGVPVFGLPTGLGDALDAPELRWVTSKNAPWAVQTNYAISGGSAAASPILPSPSTPQDASPSSSLYTEVPGPGKIAFSWRLFNTRSSCGATASQSYFEDTGSLIFMVNGVVLQSTTDSNDWERVELDLNAGKHRLEWKFSQHFHICRIPSISILDDVRWLPYPSLGDALDAPDLFWTTTPESPWISQVTNSSDGVDSAQCGNHGAMDPLISKTAHSSLYTFLKGPGDLSFSWLKSTNDAAWLGESHFTFMIDSDLHLELTNENAWIRQSVAIPAGYHRMEWRSAQGATATSMKLDQVDWSGGIARSMARCDFDGDGVSDRVVYHGASGKWYIMNSRDGFQTRSFGYSKTVPVVGDYDGDFISDLALFDGSNGTWYFLCSTAGFKSQSFGFPGVVPFCADFDGDFKDDFGVYDAASGMWYMMCSKAGFRRHYFGFSGTVPLPADYDGDGKADLAVFYGQRGMWYIMQSQKGFRTEHFGFPGVTPLSTDFDGDFKSDICCFYDGTSYMLQSSAGFSVSDQRQIGFAWSTILPFCPGADGVADVIETGFYAQEGDRDLHWETSFWDTRHGWIGLGDFGFAGSVPAVSPLVGGLSVSQPGWAGTVFGVVSLGTTPILNAWVPLVAEADSDHYFAGWSDGDPNPRRLVRATGEVKQFTAVFKHYLEGTWKGQSGTGTFQTTLVLNTFLEGLLTWPGGDQRKVSENGLAGPGAHLRVSEGARDSAAETGASYSLYIEGGDVWDVKLDADGTYMIGTGTKKSEWIPSKSAYRTYPIRLRRL